MHLAGKKLPCIALWLGHRRAGAGHLKDLSWQRGICNLLAAPWQRRATGAKDVAGMRTKGEKWPWIRLGAWKAAPVPQGREGQSSLLTWAVRTWQAAVPRAGRELCRGSADRTLGCRAGRELQTQTPGPGSHLSVSQQQRGAGGPKQDKGNFAEGSEAFGAGDAALSPHSIPSCRRHWSKEISLTLATSVPPKHPPCSRSCFPSPHAMVCSTGPAGSLSKPPRLDSLPWKRQMHPNFSACLEFASSTGQKG